MTALRRDEVEPAGGGTSRTEASMTDQPPRWRATHCSVKGCVFRGRTRDERPWLCPMHQDIADPGYYSRPSTRRPA